MLIKFLVYIRPKIKKKKKKKKKKKTRQNCIRKKKIKGAKKHSGK